MRRSLALATMLIAPCAAGAGPGLDRAGIERLFGTLAAAVSARDSDGVTAAYDPEAAPLDTRARDETKSLLALDGVGVVYRLGAMTGGPDEIEAVVARVVSYTEHGRPQVDPRWETVRLRRLAAGWRIVAEEERSYARAVQTDLAVELQPGAGTMRGSSTLVVAIDAEGEDSLLLALNRGLTVASITDGRGAPVRFTRVADAIEIPQGRGLRTGETRKLTVAFAGTLFNEAKEQGYSQVSITSGGSYASWVTSWYPRLRGSGSKSRGRITYDVPAGITVASSGRLTSARTVGRHARQVFAVDRPLDFSFAAARYLLREQTVEGVHLGVYLLRGGEAKAELYLKESARVLAYERQLFGAYPFDGYAVVEIPSEQAGALGGSSEQGMNLFPVGLLPDDSFPLLLLAHEIGHSWWGNLVGSADGPLLDEGLAQIAAAMCLRELQGEAAMRAFLERGVANYQQSAAMYFARFAGTGTDYPLGLPAAGTDAGAALHDLADTKGMFVLDMLAQTIGRDPFIAGLRAVAARFAGKRAQLADLRAAWEAASGKDLRQFFGEWLERAGAADLALEWKVEAAAQGYTVSGAIVQVGDLYHLDVEVALGFPERHEIKTVAVAERSTQFTFHTAEKPTFVVLDPEYKILRWTPALRNRRLLSDANGLWSMGRQAEACAKVDEYVAKAPESLEGRFRAGVCAEESGRLDAAERSFRAVLDRYASLGRYESWVTQSQLGLAQVFDLAGRRDDAIAAYRRVVALPDASGAHKDADAGLRARYVVPPRPAGPTRAVLARYVGSYDNGNGIALAVALTENDILTIAQPGKPAGALVWIEGARFRLPGGSDITAEFAGAPEIGAVDVKVGGNVIHLPRVK